MTRLTSKNDRGFPVVGPRPRGSLCQLSYCNNNSRCEKAKDRSCPYLAVIDRLAAYEDTGLEPEEIKELLTAHRTEMCESSGYDCVELGRYRKAEQEGRLVVLNQEEALAIGAGLAAIRNNKRLLGVTCLYDVFGKDGGPYEIPYHEAAEILCRIWNAFPLHAEAALAEMERGSNHA